MRYNIFYMVHKGLRALLYETTSSLQQTDFNNEAELALIITQVQTAIELFEKHAHAENTLIIDTLWQYEPSVVEAFEKEHDESIAIGDRISGLINELEYSDSTGENEYKGALLDNAFKGFQIFNLNHMTHEEEVINKLLWRYYSDDELKSISKQFNAVTDLLNLFNTIH